MEDKTQNDSIYSNIDENDEIITNMVELEQIDRYYSEYALKTVGNDNLLECSYKKGYLPCQALFICFTCTKNEVDAGICSACSIKCHKDHDLQSIGTKRYFRCDCGNSKFPNNNCRLIANKEHLNPKNGYSHNFKDQYCFCNQYHIPECDEMIQCCICEDWFHLNHVETVEELENKEFICRACVSKYPFLCVYENHQQSASISKSCPLKDYITNESRLDIYISSDWRKNICKCEKCFELFITNDLGFLFDEECDPQLWYQNGKQKYDITLENVYKQLSKSDRVKIDQISPHYKRLETELKRFLQPFYDNKIVVTPDDIKSFFQRFSERSHYH